MLPSIFAGQITKWHGSILSIPSGWFLCDGNNGTPDLRDRFVVGAGSTYAVGATAGAATHLHALTTDSHAHGIPPGSAIANAPATVDAATSFDSDQAITDPASSLPTYYALAFIMKG